MRVPGKVKRPLAETGSGSPKFESTSPDPWSPSTVPPIVKLGVGAFVGAPAPVEPPPTVPPPPLGADGGAFDGAPWSSSTMRDRSGALGAQPGATRVAQRHGERLGRLGLLILEQRDLHQARRGVPVAEGHRPGDGLEVLARLRRAGARGQRGAGAAVRAAGAGDEHQRRRLRLVHGVVRVAELEGTRASRPSLRAARGRRRPEPRLLEARLAAGPQAVRGEQQSSLAVLWVLDEGLRGRLAAAIVDRLSLEADVHREELARADGGQRDLHAPRVVQRHHSGRAGSAVIGVAVDVEVVLAPQRPRGVRRRRRPRPP